VASRVIEATTIVPYVAATAAFPAIIRSRELGQPVFDERVQRLHDLVFWSALVIATPLCAFADPIVRVLVGRAYGESAHLLAILAWLLPLSYAGAVRQRWLIAQNAPRAALAVEAAACGVNLVANVSLIPVLGATGAALSALISAAGGTLLAAVFSPRVRRSLAMYAASATAPLRLARWLIGQS
jgi:O-antigen/teichoic acid export membrane protein